MRLALSGGLTLGHLPGDGGGLLCGTSNTRIYLPSRPSQAVLITVTI